MIFIHIAQVNENKFVILPNKIHLFQAIYSTVGFEVIGLPV